MGVAIFGSKVMMKRRLVQSLLTAVLIGLGSGAHALEPAGVSAGKPYQVEGVIERVFLAENRLVVDGVRYRYHSPVVHPPADAPPSEVEVVDDRLRPGMRVGLKVGRGDPRPILEVWVLR